MSPNLVDRWAEENNSIAKKWKEYETHRQPLQDIRKHCYTECLKLQQKVQGVPAQTGRLKLEIAVTYNTLLFSLSCSTPNETKDCITNILIRALEAVRKQVPSYDLVPLWQAVLKTFSGTVYEPWIHKLLLIQWAVWLSERHYEGILHLLLQVNHKSTPSGDLLAETRNLAFSIEEDASLLAALTTKDLKELLHVCTFISNGVEQMKEEKYIEALVALQEASTQPSPRALLAHVHMLTGICYAKLQQPQSALQCYRKALEVDFHCHRALYQSSLVYRQLGNTNAEIEALHLLQSAVMLHAESDPSKGAEYYLDLLASLQSDSKQMPVDDGLSFPRIPVIYLEAAFALLKAKRVWDTLAICDEVIAKTIDLIPEKLLITPSIATSRELVPPMFEADAPEEKLECVLWSGAAYFLQGQAHFQLKDTKEALTNFTRAINQLVKVCIKQTVKDPGAERGAADHTVMFLEALKGKVLAFRAMCFVERGQLKEALRDFQLSLQATPATAPECPSVLQKGLGSGFSLPQGPLSELTSIQTAGTSEGAEYYLDLLASLQSDSKQMPVDDGLSFPRIPVIYLEAAFALLKAKRVWDALAICDEVIAKTIDLIPEKLLITPSMATSRELVPPMFEADAPEEKLECVLWSGAAYFLQGQAHFQLKDTKEALTNFTRAINQLVKVCIKQTVKDPGADRGAADHTVMFLEALKGKVLAFRAVCFVERGQLKEALRDFQLSLQATPGCRNTEMWLVEMMWRLDRKQEAAAMWTQILNSTQSSAPIDLPLYLQTWHEDPTSFDLSSLKRKMEEFIQNSFVTA
ncbi:hypothetical protein PDJAM_G00148260 [Pangasius djambal]|uniref:Uncharacterized protein n=1 Tax=Pangasius djambal TaxID=1691987 RepID=A0ACC5ZG29_9TELE|nr:hypothetical protein [Pangasius djambal]